VINGRVIVKEGVMLSIEMPRLLEQHNYLSRQLINGE
jgi:hypothetical protein